MHQAHSSHSAFFLCFHVYFPPPPHPLKLLNISSFKVIIPVLVFKLMNFVYNQADVAKEVNKIKPAPYKQKTNVRCFLHPHKLQRIQNNKVIFCV
jgi:hypothetical protein